MPKVRTIVFGFVVVVILFSVVVRSTNKLLGTYIGIFKEVPDKLNQFKIFRNTLDLNHKYLSECIDSGSCDETRLRLNEKEVLRQEVVIADVMQEVLSKLRKSNQLKKEG